MKRSKKIMLRVLPILMVLMVVVTTNVFAINVVDPDTISGSDKISGITNLAGSIWNTVSTIVQILAIAAIVIAGVRYMFASADTKADIKGQTVILVVGAILVFAAVPLAKFIASIANDTLT